MSCHTYALDFDGTDDYVDLPANGNMSEATIDFWCKADTFRDGGFNVIWNENAYGGGALHLQFRTTAGITQLNFARIAGNETFTYQFTAGNWYHITVKFSSASSEVQLFVNGALQETLPTSNTPITGGAGRIGIWSGDMNRGFDGIIDEFRLSGTQSAYWSFNEGSGTTAADSAGGNDGTLVNGPAWTTTTPF